ncbi:hypothetical protein RBWH47_04599 [Rhodopirellula baltica WH47]|uniref:Uncharacterized protein n=2 Tax=Rhodopirellula TaxID=265488 RepID=M2AAH4_9BACT|nr:hypothetical protein RBWH47_04599 [Rhodopirellula baltica WH47]EMB13480.1 hypothetical protein RE6C_05708 [Rhodopirellula europaea 6C]
MNSCRPAKQKWRARKGCSGLGEGNYHRQGNQTSNQSQITEERLPRSFFNWCQFKENRPDEIAKACCFVG